ncbi:hypothetical protein SAMN05192533_105256 [Mesobacillus persicus]|uniref:DUF4015 domain-containing protein n=1 Tax=Mesobacillus persicus TaxID=930146 RepID=A0A1H8B4B8_9BACI|nr:putative glycoside hydrolase [Mesobacillus persicus]SEM77189.1 hypothetical protein SAMN05192533_105256 [Mesobacillus persicus]
MIKVLTVLSLVTMLNINLLFPFSLTEPIKGIYLTAKSVSTESKFNDLTNLVANTGLNTMVIDIKDDEGRITYDSDLPLVNEIKSDQNAPIQDLASVVQILKKQDIYTIARIVVFKDPYLAKKKSEWAIKSKNNTLWKDKSGVMWVDPHRKEVWDYSISIAQEVTKLGFDEVQWDYVRFPDYKNIDKEVIFASSPFKTKEAAIGGFLKYSYSKVKTPTVTISADVFGLTTSVKDDMGIGQKWETMTQHVDVISPMMYPSHYAKGTYGIANPEADPYQLIKKGLKDAIEKNKKVQSQGKTVAKIRPWYQDFDMKVPYSLKEVQDQIHAGNELGINEYLLWNARNTYSF